MSRARVTSTSTITVPVVCGWHCSKCGSKNTSPGKLSVSESESVYPMRFTRAEREDACDEARMYSDMKLNASWKRQISSLMLGVRKHLADYIHTLTLERNSCVWCGHKEVWAESSWFSTFLKMTPLWLLPAILMILGGAISGVPRILFGVSLAAFFLYCIIRTVIKHSRLIDCPNESLPLFGTDNPEIQAYAKEMKLPIRTVDQVFESLDRMDQKLQSNQATSAKKEESQPIPASAPILTPSVAVILISLSFSIISLFVCLNCKSLCSHTEVYYFVPILLCGLSGFFAFKWRAKKEIVYPAIPFFLLWAAVGILLFGTRVDIRVPVVRIFMIAAVSLIVVAIVLLGYSLVSALIKRYHGSVKYREMTYEKMSRMHSLLEKGVITEEEYEEIKKQIGRKIEK